MRDLFESEKKEDEFRPLADRMRPERLEDFLGQEHIVAPGYLLERAIRDDKLFPMIFWGPPGSGKTTLAKIIASRTTSHFISFSAVISGVKEIRQVIHDAKIQKAHYNRQTILFVDEIHRFNKAQQDAFLPHVEKGTIILIGATTENPSFEINSALLSRTKVFVLHPLSIEEILVLLKRALHDRSVGYGNFEVHFDHDVLKRIANASGGDARVALNTLESMIRLAQGNNSTRINLRKDLLTKIVGHKTLLYDKDGEEHYNLISAFHKSLRGGDPDASIYWLTRMIESGEDPLYIARRMIRFASEDIGNADPRAIEIAISSMQAFHFIGPPEGYLALAQAAMYLATAQKSNTIYVAYGKAVEAIHKTGNLPVPLHLRNAPTKLMKDLNYGTDYLYPHDYPEALVDQAYLPDPLRNARFYFPTERGYEALIKKRLKRWNELRKKRK